MKQIKTFSDTRLNQQCAYCGGLANTRDHVPSKFLLEKPFPDNLPVVPCCLKCNSGFSLDEEHFACLIECITCNSTDIERLTKEKVKKILSKSKKLHSKLIRSFVYHEDGSYFKIENSIVENVLMKLARGHLKYEISESTIREPVNFVYGAINSFSDEEVRLFLKSTELDICPEIASRSMQSMNINQTDNFVDHWEMVQNNIYMYSVTHTKKYIKVRIILYDYLICEVIW